MSEINKINKYCKEQIFWVNIQMIVYNTSQMILPTGIKFKI